MWDEAIVSPPIYGPDITAEIGNSAVCRSFVYLKKTSSAARHGWLLKQERICCIAAEALEGTAKREFLQDHGAYKTGQCGFHMALVLPNPQKPVPAVLMISNHEKNSWAVKGPDMSALEELMARAPKEWRTDVERMMAAFQKGGASMPQLLDIERDTAQDIGRWNRYLHPGRAAAAFYAGEVQPDDRGCSRQHLRGCLPGRTRPGSRRVGNVGRLGICGQPSGRRFCAHAGIDAKKFLWPGTSRGRENSAVVAAQDTYP